MPSDTAPSDELPGDATDAMHEYLDALVDATRLANGEYADITTADMVIVLRHHATAYEEHGRDALHPRTRPDDIDPPGGLFRPTDDGAIESTARRWYNVDVGFKTGVSREAVEDDLSGEQLSVVLRGLANYLDEHGRDAVGTRTRD